MAKVAFFLPDLNGGGAERAAILLAKYWPIEPKPLIVVRATTGRYATDKDLLADLTLISLGLPRGGVAASLMTACRLARVVGDHNIDTVVSFLSLPSVLATRLFRPSLRIWASIQSAIGIEAIVQSEPGQARVIQIAYWGLGAITIPFTQGVFIPSNSFRGPGALPISRRDIPVVTLPNPIDPYLLATERKSPSQASEPLIVAAGRLVRRKRFDIFLESIAKVRQVRPVRASLFGEGPCLDELIALAQQLGISEIVSFNGFAPELSTIYGSADLFVMTSDYEGFGNVLVEALAFGLPVVSTDAPFGPAEILGGGAFGLLASCGDSDGVTAAILRCLPGGPDHERLRANARDRASHYAAPRLAQQMYSALNP
jgi:glycosyltransferase involved in cell wall biosynthesis